MQTCPHCENIIYDEDALRCLYCGERLNQPVGFTSSLKYFRGRNIAIIIGVVLIAGFIAWIL